MGQDGHGQVKINFENEGGTHTVKVEKFYLFADGFFHQPPSAVPAYYLFGWQIEIIGDDQCCFDFTVGCDGHLPDLLAISSYPFRNIF